MNMSQIHLAFTHLPVVLSLTGLVVLAISLLRGNQTATRISYYLLVAAAVTALPVFFSGEGAEEVVEHLPGVSESIIEKHESMANLSLYVVIAAGIISLGALLLKASNFRRSLQYICLVLALGSTILMAITAHLGGQVRHTEIRNGITSNAATDNNSDNDED